MELFDNLMQENKGKNSEEMGIEGKCGNFSKIISEYDIWITDDINKEY